MSSASNYTENKLLDHSLGVTAYTMPTELYVALFNNVSTQTAANLEANIITDELTNLDYGRKLVTFGAAVAGQSTNNAIVEFDEASTTWGDIDFIAIMDAATAGNVLYWGAPNLVKNIDIGDIYRIPLGGLTVTLS